MSAVIYAAIVVMWAVVLVPMWLRRHDAATESRSVERFSTAMRTLSRRTHATPGRRYVVMPRRQPGTVSIHVSGAAAAAPAKGGRPTRPAVSAARAAMVRRRRRTTFALLGLVTLTALLAVVGMFPWLAQLAGDVLLVGFLAHLRTQARRAAGVARQRGRGAVAAAPAAASARRATATAARATSARSAPAAASAAPAARPGAEPATPAVASGADQIWSDDVVPAAAVEVEIVVDETWQPVPVPPPTYTLKPPAPAAAAASYDPDATEEMQRVGDEVPTELDEILERRWAVND